MSKIWKLSRNHKMDGWIFSNVIQIQTLLLLDSNCSWISMIPETRDWLSWTTDFLTWRGSQHSNFLSIPTFFANFWLLTNISHKWKLCCILNLTCLRNRLALRFLKIQMLITTIKKKSLETCWKSFSQLWKRCFSKTGMCVEKC